MGRSLSPESRAKISKAIRLRYADPNAVVGMRGKKHTEETKRKQSEARRKWCAENRDKISGENNSMWGKTFKHADETKKKIRAAARRQTAANPNYMKGKNHPNWGRELPEEHRRKIGDANRGKKRSRRTRKILKKIANKKLKDEGYGKSLVERFKERPNKIEKIIGEITPGCVRYTGDGSWWRRLSNGRYKNPDFKITGQDKVIEILGDYWHKGENPQWLIELYRRIGLECLVIWEHEIYEQLQEVVNRIYEFISLEA